MTFRSRLCRLTVILLGAGQVVLALLAQRFALDQSAHWGASRRLVLYAGAGFLAIGLWPVLLRLWVSLRRIASAAAQSIGLTTSPVVPPLVRFLRVASPAVDRASSVHGSPSRWREPDTEDRGRSGTYALSLSEIYAAFVFLGLTVSAVWMELDRLGLGWHVGLTALFCLLCSPRWKWLTSPRSFRVGFPRARLTLPALLTGLLTVLPALSFLAFTFQQEFPFSGDQSGHLVAARESLHFLSRYGLFAILFWVGVATFCSRYRLRWWPLVVLVLLDLFSLTGSVPGPFADHPGTAFFLTLPFTAIARLFDWNTPLNASRLASFVSLPVYLFLLRPIVIKRWPDLALLPFAAYFFLQKDLVYYLTSAYLEPWSVVFVLLSVESLVMIHFRRRADRLWLPPLLCGGAALIKEQAILLLPWIVLAAYLPYLRKEPGSRGEGPRERSVRWDRVAEMLFSGVFSALPFLIYYRFRVASEVVREVRRITWEDASSIERAYEWAYRLQVQFGEIGVLLWVGVGVGSVGYILFGRRRDDGRLLVSLLLAAAITQILFFYLDANSAYWTGYPRFQLQAWVLWGGVLILVGWHLDRQGRRAAAMGLLALVLSLHLPALTGTFKTVFGPDSARSYTEHYDAPLYFPIRALFREAGQELARVTDIHVVTLIVSPWFSSYNVARLRPHQYPDLYSQFRFIYHPAGREEPHCSCEVDSEATLLLFWNPVGLNTENGPGMYVRQRTPNAEQRRRAETCLATLRASCRSVRQEVSPSTGRVTAALGTGPTR